MEKYAVVIDPKKVEKEKKGSSGDKVPHPETNIPLDPVEGSRPYEKKPEEK